MSAPKRTLTTRMAYGSFAMAILGLLPGVTYPHGPPAPFPRQQIENAIEIAIAAVIISVMALVLALITLRRFRKETDLTGKSFAKWALGIGVFAGILWLVMALIGFYRLS